LKLLFAVPIGIPKEKVDDHNDHFMKASGGLKVITRRLPGDAVKVDSSERKDKGEVIHLGVYLWNKSLRHRQVVIMPQVLVQQKI
jgi:hypothetical protein